MKKAVYSRMGKCIQNSEDNKTEHFKSINQAKRKSRELQMKKDGTLGRGSLQKI